MVHLVTYDLKSPNDTGADYDRVIAAIKEHYGAWCHLEKSVWLVSTPLAAGEVRDALTPYFYSGDVVFVARLEGNWGSRNLSTSQVKWLKDRTF